METQTFTLTCPHHNRTVSTLLLASQVSGMQPRDSSNTQNDSPTKMQTEENSQHWIHVCSDCLASIPAQEKAGALSLKVKHLAKLFKSIQTEPLKEVKETRRMIDLENRRKKGLSSFAIEELVELYKNTYADSMNNNFSKKHEEYLINQLRKLTKPYKQKIVLEKQQTVDIGTADFSLECFAHIPETSQIFVGNRAGRLYVIDRFTKKIAKEIACPERIGAVKYIQQKNVVIVSGLNKFIWKIDAKDLTVMTPSLAPQTSTYRNYIVVEYLPKQNQLLMGGFNVENSIELYNFDDLSLVKTINFRTNIGTRTDELWVSKTIEHGNMMLLGYSSGQLQLWKTDTFKKTTSVSCKQHIYALEYNETQKWVYTGHIDGAIQIWKKCRDYLIKLKHVETGGSSINKLRFLPSQKYFLVSNYSQKMSVFDYMGEKVDETEAFEDPSRAITVLDEQNIVCAGATTGKVYFLQLKDGEKMGLERVAGQAPVLMG